MTTSAAGPPSSRVRWFRGRAVSGARGAAAAAGQAAKPPEYCPDCSLLCEPGSGSGAVCPFCGRSSGAEVGETAAGTDPAPSGAREVRQLEDPRAPARDGDGAVPAPALAAGPAPARMPPGFAGGPEVPVGPDGAATGFRPEPAPASSPVRTTENREPARQEPVRPEPAHPEPTRQPLLWVALLLSLALIVLGTAFPRIWNRGNAVRMPVAVSSPPSRPPDPRPFLMRVESLPGAKVAVPAVPPPDPQLQEAREQSRDDSKSSRRAAPGAPPRFPERPAPEAGSAAAPDLGALLGEMRAEIQRGKAKAAEEAERQARDKERELAEAAWRRRLEEIRALIAEGKFPEAIQLAKRLGAEAGAPDEVAAEARRLGSEAAKRLADAFSATHWQPATNKVETKPPADEPPRERRFR
jgi:hypothetical protein